MAGSTMKAVLIAFCVAALAALACAKPLPRKNGRTSPAVLKRAPAGFEAFDEVSRRKARNKDAQNVQCNDVKEPQIPPMPRWAYGRGSRGIGKNKGIEQLVQKETGRAVGAFTFGSDIVIKTCDWRTLETAVKFTRPNKHNRHPTFRIFFSCGEGRHRIPIQETLAFGSGQRTTSGDFSLIAHRRNVEINGRNKYRIARVMRNAKLTASGITFQRGAQINFTRQKSKVPSGGFNGGAILVAYSATLIAHNSVFLYNTALSYFARWGGGGAIKCETNSFTIVWGCTFRGNRASTGGAIGGSSATAVYIAYSTFEKNTAFGGLDASAVTTQGKKKPMILCRGGSIRFDSLTGFQGRPDEHVVICNSDFTGNMVRFSKKYFTKILGYRYPRDIDFVRANGAAITAWNARENLNIKEGDHHFLTVVGVNFYGNMEKVGPFGRRSGKYVFEVEGAGHVNIEHVMFDGNNVQEAVAKFDNSNRFNDGLEYELDLRNIVFKNNGPVYNLAFEANYHDSSCNFRNVDGIPNQKNDCKRAVQHGAQAVVLNPRN